MRFADAAACCGALLLLAPATHATGTPSAIHRQRYCMGTMFDIFVYHSPRAEAEGAATRAMEEIARLDRVMSHYRADSDLSKLVREARAGFAIVERSLFEVIQESVAFSRRSGGMFDVTVAPLVRTWREAHAEGRRPSPSELSAAAKCVGYDKIEAIPPDRIRFRSDCLDIDLGGIGKGYAVDRAIGVLEAAGIRHALVNAGSSSIASIGSPPGREGWPVSLGADSPARRTLLLRDGSVSTSQQSPSGEIVDPRTARAAASPLAITVVAPRATVSDALSTTLLLLSIEDGRQLLPQFDRVSALWFSPGGELKAGYGEARLQLTGASIQ